MSKRIPRKEVELVALGKVMAEGFKLNPSIFPTPPFTSEQLETSINKVDLSISNVAVNKGHYEAAVQAKDLEVKDLYQNITDNAEYCYKITKENKALLAMVGLTARAENKPVELPGQCRDFTAVKQEVDRVTFEWKHPVSGGKARSYIIQCNELDTPKENWINLWTAIDKKAEIRNQPEGKVFQYRVRGLNATGIGAPSNIVTLKF